MSFTIPFHKLFRTHESLESVSSIKLNTDCYQLECIAALERHGYQNLLLTDSCTRALEISAHLLGLELGDEVIVPSYGYVSTADVFSKMGALLCFADSLPNHPNVDPNSIEQLITDKTRAVAVIHYGGLKCDMESIKRICDEHSLALVEDNAHGIGRKEPSKPISGDFSALSFHSTKNIHSFAGGALTVNRKDDWDRAVSYLNKGTDKAAFLAGHVPFYQWTGNGNSSALSELSTGFLANQLRFLEYVNERRMAIWEMYHRAFVKESFNTIANYVSALRAPHNAHIYAIMFPDAATRNRVQSTLKTKGIDAYAHYNSLHRSVKGVQYGMHYCANADRFSDGLLRLPIYPGLSDEEVHYVIDAVLSAVEGA